MDHQHQWPHTNTGNISRIWYQGYKPGVKGLGMDFIVDFCNTIHQINIGHDACMI